jgi:hypothetical protein
MPVQIDPLPYISYDIKGGLGTLQIGPLPNPATGIIESNTLMINATLADLGKPGKPSPGSGGPGGGQYIELLVDDEAGTSRITSYVPYAMQLSNGTHMLHFILSSGDGECIKEGVQGVSRVVHIQTKDKPWLSDAGPMIIYNLPRTAHRVNDVTIDFALVNVPVGPIGLDGMIPILNHTVSVRLAGGGFNGGEVTRLHAANTHTISGLTPGTEYTITLVLIDNIAGELDPVQYPYARTKPRAFTIH